MPKKSDGFVDQIRLAAALEVTTRRVRQMVDQHILPPAHHETGLYDRDLCEDRYDLYRDGRDRDWAEFYDKTEMKMNETAKLWERAMADGATIADVTKASLAVQADMTSMRFITACRSSGAERDVWLLIWSREENQAMGQLLGRVMQVLGKQFLVDEETGEVVGRMPVYPPLPASLKLAPPKAT